MKKPQKNWLEWAVFAAGLVLVTATVGYLAYSGATMGEAPPVLEVGVGPPEQRGGHFAVPVTILNRGDETAAGVEVEVTLEGAGAEPERAQFTVAFVPRKAQREGRVTFTRDPRQGRLTARVLGFEKP